MFGNYNLQNWVFIYMKNNNKFLSIFLTIAGIHFYRELKYTIYAMI